MPITYNFKVDLKLKPTAATPTIVQYDDAQINFQIFDGGKVFDLTNYNRVEVTHKKPDGSVVIGEGEITVNEKGFKIVRYDYQGSEMTKLGFVEASFAIFDADSNKVSIRPFKVYIVDDLRNGLAATAEYGILQDLIVEMNTGIANTTAQTDYAQASGDYATAQGVYATTKGDEALAYSVTETDAIVDYTKEIADANINIPLNPVANFTALATTYPTPAYGSKAQTTDDGKIYRWDGTVWKYVEIMNSNILTDIQNKLAIGLVEINATAPTTTATFWLDTSTP